MSEQFEIVMPDGKVLGPFKTARELKEHVDSLPGQQRDGQDETGWDIRKVGVGLETPH